MDILNDVVQNSRFLLIPHKRGAGRARLEQRRASLRKLLRDSPNWPDGHIELAFNELQILLGAQERPAARSISTVRVSGEAVLQLMSKRSAHRAWNARRVFEARVLIAMSLFLLRRYEDAYEQFSGILAYNNRRFLRPHVLFLALEYAGLTSYLLERFEEAHDYLSSVPDGKLSDQGKEAFQRSAEGR